MAIDLRSLRYFVAMAATGSVSRAAEEVHVAQPALSSHLKMMEAELGVSLFDRTAKGILLTAAGARFLAHSREILERMKVALEDVRDTAEEPVGTVCLGMPQSIGLALTVRLVTEAARRWPRLHLQIMEIATGHVRVHLASRNIDLGIVFFKEKNSGLHYTGLIDEELVLVGAPGNFPQFPADKLQDARKTDFAVLASIPLFLPSRQHSLRQLIEWHAAKAKVKLHSQADVDAIPQLISLVSEGLGYSILSYPAVLRDLEQKRISVARLIRPNVIRTVYMCRVANVPTGHAVEAVEGLIVDLIQQLIAERRWPGRNNVT